MDILFWRANKGFIHLHSAAEPLSPRANHSAPDSDSEEPIPKRLACPFKQGPRGNRNFAPAATHLPPSRLLRFADAHPRRAPPRQGTVLVDARTVPRDTVLETEVCVVGGGAAGITLAREFTGQPFRVILLESGGLKPDVQTQSLYKGPIVGLPYPPLGVFRLRYLGGCTNHWGGYCQPLDDIDFEPRDWIPYSGWPFDKTHLTPFYERAQAVCQLGPFAYNPDPWERAESLRLPFSSDRVATKVLQFSAPTKFGKAYQRELDQSKNVTVCLNGNMTEVETTRNAATATRIRVACLRGSQFWIAAKYFILATGGIENARLLLLSNKVQLDGLGNQNDLVGRFFMEHPHLDSATIVLSSPLRTSPHLYRRHPVDETVIRGFLILSADCQRCEKLSNFSAILSPEAKGLQVLGHLRWGDSQDLLQDIVDVIADVDDIAVGAYSKLRRGFIAVHTLAVQTQTESIPNPESRVSLITERDALGLNRVKLDWRMTSFDKQAIRRALLIVGQELGRAGLGRLRIDMDDNDSTWPPTLQVGHHHMGTTRMHTNAKMGVVDANCCVHGMRNLFVAGSSVFPTSGSANPTLTIVALATRLADHLTRILRSSAR